MLLRSACLFGACLLHPLAASSHPADEPRLRVPIEGAPSRGAASPLVTMVVFSDFQCPFCARVQPTLERILREYPSDVRIYFRHRPLPFHQNAMAAAEAAVEAQAQGGDATFWTLHDRMFASQHALERADIERYAGEVGLDMASLRTVLDSGGHRPRIESESGAGERLGAMGVPSFFINGRSLTGAQAFERFEEVIQAEQGAARAALRRGVRRARLYAHFMRRAVDAPVPAPVPAAPAAPGAPAPSADLYYSVPIDGSPSLGPDDALVTMVVFSDFQCPFCARVEPTLRALRELYGRDLRIVWKNNPLEFHVNAMHAAEVAQEAFDQGKFWQMHDALLADQTALAMPALLERARRLGMNVSRLQDALDRHVHLPSIQRDRDLAARLGATGTPAFFINGRMLSGAQPIERFREAIDRELSAASAEVARGTPRARIYERIVRTGALGPSHSL